MPNKIRNPFGFPEYHGHPHLSADCDVFDAMAQELVGGSLARLVFETLTSGFVSDTAFAWYGLDGLTAGADRLALGSAHRVTELFF